MTTRTTKKTAPTTEAPAVQAEVEPTAAPVTEASPDTPEAPPTVPAETAGPLPSATPLDAPTPPAEIPEPEPNVIAIADAIPASLSGLIVDAETVNAHDPIGRPPSDLDAVFVKATPNGTEGIALLRLLEHTSGGRHERPMTRLLVAKGSRLSGSTIAGILQRLEDQAAVHGAITADSE